MAPKEWCKCDLEKGKQLTKQRVRYSIIENFNSSFKSDLSEYRQLLIIEIEKDGISIVYMVTKQWVGWEKKQDISFK